MNTLTSASSDFHLSKFQRFLFFTVTVVLPITSCIILQYIGTGPMAPTWQTGRLADNIGLLMHPDVGLFFYPLLAFATLSFALLILKPQKFAQSFFVRFGIYTSVLVYAQYAVMMSRLSLIGAGTGLAFWGMAALLRWFYNRVSRKTFWILLVVFCLSVWVTGSFFVTLKHWHQQQETHIVLSNMWLIRKFLINGASVLQGVLIALVLLSLCSGPIWCLMISLWVCFRLLRVPRGSFSAPSKSWIVSSWTAWLSAFAVSWVAAVHRAIEIYQTLPKQKPDNCYIATAAARGHHDFVGSTPISLPGGQTLWINEQRRYCKLMELALREKWPMLHKRLRKIYNVVGPVLARRITNPWLADLAYVCLKPCELIARAALALGTRRDP